MAVGQNPTAFFDYSWLFDGRHTRVLRPQYTHATRRIPREKCESHAMPTPL